MFLKYFMMVFVNKHLDAPFVHPLASVSEIMACVFSMMRADYKNCNFESAVKLAFHRVRDRKFGFSQVYEKRVGVKSSTFRDLLKIHGKISPAGNLGRTQKATEFKHRAMQVSKYLLKNRNLDHPFSHDR